MGFLDLLFRGRQGGRKGRPPKMPERETRPFPTLMQLGMRNNKWRYLCKPRPRNLRYFSHSPFARRARTQRSRLRKRLPRGAPWSRGASMTPRRPPTCCVGTVSETTSGCRSPARARRRRDDDGQHDGRAGQRQLDRRHCQVWRHAADNVGLVVRHSDNCRPQHQHVQRWRHHDSTGAGQFRQVTQQSIPANVTASFASGTLVVSAA
jgi:hypothetical protein